MIHTIPKNNNIEVNKAKKKKNSSTRNDCKNIDNFFLFIINKKVNKFKFCRRH